MTLFLSTTTISNRSPRDPATGAFACAVGSRLFAMGTYRPYPRNAFTA